MDFTLACDVLLDLEGSVRPAMILASELMARGHRVSMMSPIMSNDVEERFRVDGITPINLRAKFAVKNSGLSLLWLEMWAREAFLKLNSRRFNNGSSVMINFSQVISAPSLVWYLQGPPSTALKDMQKELSTGFRVAYNIAKPIIEYADERLISRMGRASTFVIANSKFCGSMYSKFGVKDHDEIYPPIDCKTFRPLASRPSSNYVLTYFGKETEFSVVKKVADMGVRIKAFGSKTPFIQRGLSEHPNIEFLGKVSINELVELYSNALFTLFPFTHEPFGYVPLESMACGTPVLTYNMQGPSEYVIDEWTGWLANTDDELTRKAVELWKEGYPSHMRMNCVEEASKFDKKFYVERWIKLLDNLCEDKSYCSAILKNENLIMQ
jgi:glycosyltransferase involved in cell wall biosynthesis